MTLKFKLPSFKRTKDKTIVPESNNCDISECVESESKPKKKKFLRFILFLLIWDACDGRWEPYGIAFTLQTCEW